MSTSSNNKLHNKLLDKCIKEHKTAKFYHKGNYVSDDCIRRIKKFILSLSFKEVIRIAVISKGVDFNDRIIRCSHQRQNESTLIDFFKNLLRHEKGLSTILLNKNFDHLFKKIESIGKEIHNVGPLCIYDVTLRIACYNETKPEWIYLHAGTKKGAIALLGKNFINAKKSITVQDFKEKYRNDFKMVTNEMMEDILCEYSKKSNLKETYRIC